MERKKKIRVQGRDCRGVIRSTREAGGEKKTGPAAGDPSRFLAVFYQRPRL